MNMNIFLCLEKMCMPINSGYEYRSIKDPQTILRGFNLITGVIIDKRSTVPIILKKYYQLQKKSPVYKCFGVMNLP